MAIATKKILTKIPARLDRLPWTRWHWFIVFSLGIVWVLDGLEVTIKGAVGPSLRQSLEFSTVGVAGLASIYLLGAVAGALLWGYMTDKYGRQKLFIVTIGVYIVGVAGTAVTGLWIFGVGYEFVWFGIFRFITGFGIGGEYAAINSTIDELIPARVRGWVDLAINGSYWLGALFGAVLGAVYLNVLSADLAFRLAFGTGLVLGVGILLLRLFVPESPRWLLTHGRPEEAERTVGEIEDDVLKRAEVDELEEVDDDDSLELRERESIGFIELGRTLFRLYPQRSVVAFSLLLTQAFLYNAIFFTFGLMLTTFFGVSNANVGWFLVPFAIGNFLGPLILGRYFDTVGRRTMIPLTFLTAAGLTVLAGFLFATGVIATAAVMTAFWMVIFFFASAGASAGYLTASETFPLEIRAMAIAFFYAFPTLIGGVAGPILFGALITGSPWTVFWGYLVGAGLMAIGGLIHRKWGIEAAQQSLESVTMPLSAEEADDDGTGPRELSGPAGVDPGDPESVRDFQENHELEEDGVIGPETSGALRAAVAGGEDAGTLASVELANPDAIREFQREHGLRDDAIVGPLTRGALRIAETRFLLDPADEESIRDFQRRHEIAELGIIDQRTQAAIGAVRAEAGDGAATLSEPDALDSASVRSFQSASGLDASGDVDRETQGAIRALRAWRARNGGLDPIDPESIESFQRDHELEPDGVIGERTRDAIRTERERAAEPLGRPRGFGVDPADPDSIRRVQLRIGLAEDGVIGPETQGALRVDLERRAAVGAEQDEGGDEDEDLPSAGGLLAFDPADPDTVRSFQSDHGLTDDGTIGPRTQAALRAALATTERDLLQRPRADSGAGGRPPARRRAPSRRMASGLPSAAFLPDEDRDYDRELEDLVGTLSEAGDALARSELAKRVGARHWGPGRFRYVLRTAEREGAVRKVGRDRYTAAG